MNHRDQEFGQAAIEKGYLSDREWEDYCRQWVEGKKWAANAAQLLLREKVLNSQQVQEIREDLWQKNFPSQIGEYKILEVLGQGGMGRVLKARGEGDIVALKVLSPAVISDGDRRRRFFREIESVTSLQHPNIVQALDYGFSVEKNLAFVALEYIEGPDLQKVVMKEGPLLPGRALDIAEKVCQALDYAASNHIIHRDIKPENILLSKKEEVKITDFGLAKKLDSHSITQTGTMMGTPYYIAPEISQGEKEISVSADIYSLSITLFYLLCGKPPFFKGNSMQIVMQHIVNPLPSLKKFRKDLSPPLYKALQGLMESMAKKDPLERLSPSEVCDQIDRIKEEFFSSPTSKNSISREDATVTAFALSPPKDSSGEKDMNENDKKKDQNNSHLTSRETNTQIPPSSSKEAALKDETIAEPFPSPSPSPGSSPQKDPTPRRRRSRHRTRRHSSSEEKTQVPDSRGENLKPLVRKTLDRQPEEASPLVIWLWIVLVLIIAFVIFIFWWMVAQSLGI